jgi:hypothetical protein
MVLARSEEDTFWSGARHTFGAKIFDIAKNLVVRTAEGSKALVLSWTGQRGILLPSTGEERTLDIVEPVGVSANGKANQSQYKNRESHLAHKE